MPKSKACVEISSQQYESVENPSPSALSCNETTHRRCWLNQRAGCHVRSFSDVEASTQRRLWLNRRRSTLSKRPSRESTRRRRRRRSTGRRRRRTAAAGCSPGQARPRLPSAARLQTRRGGRRRSPARRRGGKRSSPRSSSTSSSTATVVRTGKGTNLVTTPTLMAVAMATVPTVHTAVRTATPRRTLNRVRCPSSYMRTGQLCLRNRHGFVSRRLMLNVSIWGRETGPAVLLSLLREISWSVGSCVMNFSAENEGCGTEPGSGAYGRRRAARCVL